MNIQEIKVHRIKKEALSLFPEIKIQYEPLWASGYIVFLWSAQTNNDLKILDFFRKIPAARIGSCIDSRTASIWLGDL